jgi:hypothetical protein
MARKRVTRGSVRPAGLPGDFYTYVDVALLDSSADVGVLVFQIGMLAEGVGMRVQVYYAIGTGPYVIGQSVIGTALLVSYAVGSGIANGVTVSWYMQLRTTQGELVATQDGVPFVTAF